MNRRIALLLSILAAALAAEDSFDAEFRRGLLALSHNDLPAARQNLEDASRLQPANGLVWAALAQTYLRGKEPKMAEDAAGRAAALESANPAVEHALALYYSETGEIAKAAEQERRYASSGPADPQAAARAADLSLRAGDTAEAIRWAAAAVRHADTAPAHYLLSQAYAAAGRPDEALAELREAVKRDVQNEAYFAELGQMELRRGDFPRALATLGAGRARFPNNPQIALAYGVAAYGERRFSDAMDAFLAVIRIDPTVEQPYVFLARLLDQAGPRLAQITAAYTAWAKAAPSNCLPICLHAKALSAAGGDAAEIEAELRHSIQLNAAYWESHFELGALLAREQRWAEAAPELTRAIQLNPQHAAAHFQLARVYEKLGKPDLAQAERAEHQRLTAAETNAASQPMR